MSGQFYVYELQDDEREVPRRIGWDGWRTASDWLQEPGLDAEGQMARHVEMRQVRQVVQQTAGLDEIEGGVYVAPLPDLRGAALMFGFAADDADYVVSTVELPWLLAQAVNGWEAAMAFSVERIGGRDTDGYFDDKA